MNSTWWKRGAAVVAVIGLAAGAQAEEAAQNFTPSPGQRIILVRFNAGEDAEAETSDNPKEAPEASKQQIRLPEYWLGIDCVPVSAAMRAQLKIEDGKGIVVADIVADSPAAKAGLKQYDVLLSANDKSLSDISDLVALIDENKDKGLSLEVLREGSKTTIKVTPEKRPEPKGPVRDRLHWLGEDGDEAMEMMREHLRKAGVPMRMHFFHPGIMVKGSAGKFPKDLHIHIDKHGDKPAEIVVERGDKKWTVTEDKLSELPKDVRPHVEAFLGRMMPFDVEIDQSPLANGEAGFGITLPPPGELSNRIEKRLEEMNRRMEEMRKQLNEMRQQRRERREERRGDDAGDNAGDNADHEKA